MCKSLYFLVGKVADCVNFVSALLLEAQSTPFQITPSTMANIVKGLYTLRPGKKGKCLYWFHLVIVICLPKCVYSLTDELLIAKVCCVLCIIMLSSTLVLVAHRVGDLGKVPCKYQIHFKKNQASPLFWRQREDPFLLCRNKKRRIFMGQSWQKFRSIELVKVVLRVTLQTTRCSAWVECWSFLYVAVFIGII